MRYDDGVPPLKRGQSVPAFRIQEQAAPSAPRISNDFRTNDESPRQVVTGLCLLFILMGMAATQLFIDTRPGASFRQGMCALLYFLMAYCGLNTKDGALTQPHPGFWRLLHGCNLWYSMLLAILLVIPREDGSILMGWMFPGVDRTPSEPQQLGFDHLTCTVTWENVKRQLFGLWFFAHCVGWWAKMIMLRELKTCLIYSTAFEMTELTLQFLVPEFQECWWDSLFMDWLIANLLIGMMMGKATLHFLSMKEFRWQSGDRATKLWAKISLAGWGEKDWNPANDPITMLLNCVIWIVMGIGEVNSFFLINILHLPRDHLFNAIRQILLCLMAVPAVEEWYEYTRHVRAEYTTKYTYGREWAEYKKLYMGRKPRIGHMTWLLTVTISLELMAVVKYSIGHVRATAPGPEIWGPWAAFTCLFSVYFSIHCWLFYKKERMYPFWLRVLKWASFAPLFLLGRLYAF